MVKNVCSQLLVRLRTLVYHRICLTQIEIFRFIRIRFVCDEISASQSCVLLSTAPLSLSKSDHDTPFSESMAKRLGRMGCTRGRDDGWFLSGVRPGKSEER